MNWVNSIYILLLAYVVVFLEAKAHLIRDWFGIQIDLLPALMVYTSLTSGIVTIGLLAVLGGLWFDSLSLNPLGTTILPLFIIGFAIYQYRDVLLRDNSFAQLVLGLSANALFPLMALFLLLNRGITPLVGWKWIWHWFIGALAGGFLTPVCFLFFDWLHRNFNYRPERRSGHRPDREIKRGRI